MSNRLGFDSEQFFKRFGEKYVYLESYQDGGSWTPITVDELYQMFKHRLLTEIYETREYGE